MTSYNVFGSETPSVINGDDNDDYALGTVVEIDSSGNITHARQYFSNPLPTGPVTWHVSDLNTLDLLGFHVFTSPASGWVEQALSSPIPIVGPRNVLVWCGTPDGYVFTNGRFNGVAITNGPLTAPASADDPEGVGNGRFGGDPESPPLGTSGQTAYFADLIFDVPAPQGSAAFAINLAVAAAGERDSQGAAAFAINLAVAAAGDAPAIPPSEGDAELGLLFSVSGTGDTPSVDPAGGSAAFGLNMAVAAAGLAPDPGQASGAAAFGAQFSVAGTGLAPDPGQASGSAAFTLNLALAAAGDSSPFPCRPVRSFSEVLTR